MKRFFSTAVKTASKEAKEMIEKKIREKVLPTKISDMVKLDWTAEETHNPKPAFKRK